MPMPKRAAFLYEIRGFIPHALQGMQFPDTFEIHVPRVTLGDNYLSKMAPMLSPEEGVAVAQRH